MAAPRFLDPLVGVRVPVPQFFFYPPKKLMQSINFSSSLPYEVLCFLDANGKSYSLKPLAYTLISV